MRDFCYVVWYCYSLTAEPREHRKVPGGGEIRAEKPLPTDLQLDSEQRVLDVDTRHGLIARLRRGMQFSLMDQLPAMAWYEAALREGKSVGAVRTTSRPETLTVVETLKAAGGHFINRFGRFDTEEFARWRGPEPEVPDVMRH